MSSSHDRRIEQAREFDKLSTILIDTGVHVVKKNPIKVSLYLVGLAICFLFNGVKLSIEQTESFDNELSRLDHLSVDQAAMNVDRYSQVYRRSQGWFFSCDNICQKNKESFDEAVRYYNTLRTIEDMKIRSAKSKVGVFSEYGVGEARSLFWQRFGQGKDFATRQSKWDALFMGMRAMGRDESLPTYLLRLLMNVLINFTIGVCGAVVAFIFSLYGLIQSYQAPIAVALSFFFFASLAAVSFALTWLIALYVGTAGTVFVAAKLISANMRIEGGGRDPRGRPRVRYE